MCAGPAPRAGRSRETGFGRGAPTRNAPAQAVVIPAAAITEFAGIEKVWRVVDGQAEEVVVATGERRDSVVVIRAGIEAGDTIVTDPSKARAGDVVVQE